MSLETDLPQTRLADDHDNFLNWAPRSAAPLTFYMLLMLALIVLTMWAMCKSFRDKHLTPLERTRRITIIGSKTLLCDEV
ncbi:hypothetical protein AAVH_40072 [Aphelenchoides avenae]|nr:hypothetical protein AAVH_40072 [Aphelenchus avenae]